MPNANSFRLCSVLGFVILLTGCSERSASESQTAAHTNINQITFAPAKRRTPPPGGPVLGAESPGGEGQAPARPGRPGVPGSPEPLSVSEEVTRAVAPSLPSQVEPRALPQVTPPLERRRSPPARPGREDPFDTARAVMVTNQLAVRGITDPVLSAMAAVPRHQVVPSQLLVDSYDDMELNLGHNTSLRSPFAVATVGQLFTGNPNARILEIGSDGGYTASVLSQLVKEVHTVAPNNVMAQRVAVDLQRIGFTNNVFVDHLEGLNWTRLGPYDGIVVNAPDISHEMLAQLVQSGGRVVMPPDANGNQQVYQKSGGSLLPQSVHSVRPPPVAPNKVAMRPNVLLRRLPN